MNKEMLVLLEQQIDNFKELKNYISSKGLTPSSMFLPQSLKYISEDLNFKPNLILEAISYLDVVKFYSIIVFNDSELFTKSIIDIIVENRTVDNINNSINKDAVDDFIFNKKEEAYQFFYNNKVLISLYLFSLVSLVCYKES